MLRAWFGAWACASAKMPPAVSSISPKIHRNIPVRSVIIAEPPFDEGIIAE
jgi:hypothetical protein